MDNQGIIEHLQELRASGQPLPGGRSIPWDQLPQRAASGLFVVSQENSRELDRYEAMPGKVLASLASVGFVITWLINSGVQGPIVEVQMLQWIFAGLILMGLLSTRKPAKPVQLEISHFPLRPGQGALLMLPKGERQQEITSAWLLLQECITVNTVGATDRVQETPIDMMPLVLDLKSESLLSSHVTIPVDAPPSYESDGYQLRWGIEVERANGQREFFLLWVTGPDIPGKMRNAS